MKGNGFLMLLNKSAVEVVHSYLVVHFLQLLLLKFKLLLYGCRAVTEIPDGNGF